jgi:hypothetical protein
MDAALHFASRIWTGRDNGSSDRARTKRHFIILRCLVNSVCAKPNAFARVPMVPFQQMCVAGSISKSDFFHRRNAWHKPVAK